MAELIIRTHKLLNDYNINTVSESQIIPVILKTPDKAGEIAEKLKKEGYFILPIRPPSVPIGTSRLRLSLTANIQFKEVIKLFELIKDEI